MTDQFARWAVWDNSGDKPEYVDGSGLGPDDPTSMPGFYPPAAARRRRCGSAA
jgi:hypothetical protein